MSAEHWREEFDAYIDGELDGAALTAVEAHLRACAACRDEVQARRDLQARLAAHPVPDPGPRYWSEFAARVEARTQPGRTSARGYERLAGWLFPAGRFAWPRAAGALAACTLVLYVGLRGFDPERAQWTSRRVAPPPASAPPTPAPAPEPAPPPAAVGETPVPQLERVEGTPPPAHQDARRQSKTQQVPTAPVPPALADRDASGSQPAEIPSADAARPEAKSGELAAAAEKSQMHIESSREGVAPASPDPTLQFLAAATTGDTAGVRALAAQPGLDGDVRDSMRHWLELASAPPPPPRAGMLKSAPVPAPSGAPSLGFDRAPAGAPETQGASAITAWLLLDDVAWPRRDEPQMRDMVARITSGLVPHAADPRVAARARAATEWLAATSPSAAEQRRWQELRAALPSP